jgi:uncharacterized protein (DUF1800 family)
VSMNTSNLRAAIAAHRFGLTEPELGAIGSDAGGWLLSQIGPADPARGEGLATSATGLRQFYAFRREQRETRRADAAEMAKSTETQFGEHFRAIVEADLRSRLATAATTQRPFAERLAIFWSNHFTVSMAKASARGMVGAFEREAIRPHIAGSFETLLKSAVKHTGMLRYLDNALSAGPNSRVVAIVARRAERNSDVDGQRSPRLTGLNENLAREVLELHTLGVDSAQDRSQGARAAYTQRDVTEFARVLTGWRVPGPNQMDDLRGDTATLFDPNWHEPGDKLVLGKTYREGPQALDEVLHDLAHHPATARFIATKLARHFVADAPPTSLVSRLATAFTRSDGNLNALYQSLIEAPESWQAEPVKLKTPEEFVISTARLLRLGERVVGRGRDAGISTMGQRVQAAPSPAGWPDRAEEWLGPEAVWKRVEWATRLAERVGSVDARSIARASLGPLLSPSTAEQIERAADPAQALALLLMAPEFQRR